MTKATIGFAMCGSFCTFSKAFTQMQRLVDSGYDVIPIMSQNAFSTSTRFGKAEETVKRAEEITGKAVLHSVVQTEPIGPKKMCDLLVIAPCTGNTLAKLAAGIADGPVTLAAKAHLRNERPVIVAVSTNDALAGNAANLGRLLNRRGYYFVPFGQDSAFKKPRSLVADFTRLPQTVESALRGEQVQPILYGTPVG